MSTDLTLLGLLSPAVAVAGDMAIAVVFTLLVINPAYLLWRGPTRRIERTAKQFQKGVFHGARVAKGCREQKNPRWIAPPGAPFRLPLAPPDARTSEAETRTGRSRRCPHRRRTTSAGP